MVERENRAKKKESKLWLVIESSQSQYQCGRLALYHLHLHLHLRLRLRLHLRLHLRRLRRPLPPAQPRRPPFPSSMCNSI